MERCNLRWTLSSEDYNSFKEECNYYINTLIGKDENWQFNLENKVSQIYQIFVDQYCKIYNDFLI